MNQYDQKRVLDDDDDDDDDDCSLKTYVSENW
jgi:hypothetical protein